MYKLSCWASEHRFAARVLICFLHCLLWALAYYVLSHDLVDPFFGTPAFLTLLTSTIAAIIFFYQLVTRFRPSFSRHTFYMYRKTADFLICATSWLLLIGVMSSYDSQQTGNLYGAVTMGIRTADPSAQEILNSLSYRDRKSLTFREKRILKKELKRQVANYASAAMKGNKKGMNAAVQIILTIIAAIGVFILIASLACSLSCSGNDVAAVMLLVLGLAVIILIVSASLKGIKKRKRQGIPPQSPPST